MAELGIVVALAASAVAYGFVFRRARNRQASVDWSEAVAFVAGLTVVGVALLSPIDGKADSVLWLHMVQHVLLISVAAPLIALGRPGVVVPPAWRRWTGTFGGARGARRAWELITFAAVVQVLTLLVWHLPVLYDAAVRHDPVHATEHVTLLLTATLLWMSLCGLSGEQAGLAILVVFVVSFPPLLLGAAMTFAGTLWYPAYAADGRDALADQQLAGVIMWAYGGLAAVAGGVYLFASWLRRLEAASPGRGLIAVTAPGVSSGLPTELSSGDGSPC
jgi:cytochrome c oxidase assembly factor CtaG